MPKSGVVAVFAVVGLVAVSAGLGVQCYQAVVPPVDPRSPPQVQPKAARWVGTDIGNSDDSYTDGTVLAAFDQTEADCSSSYTDVYHNPEQPLSYDQRLADQDRVSQYLAQSPDAEHLVVAAVLDPDAIHGLELKYHAVESAPDNPLVLWNAAMSCHDPDLCPSLEWLQRLSELDSGNGEVWMSLAVEQLRLGETQAALASLEAAASASTFDIYWADTIEMGLRAFSASGSGLSFSSEAEYSIDIAVTSLPRYGSYVTLCEELSEVNALSAENCLRVAQSMKTHAKSEMTRQIASAMEIESFKQLGDGQQAEALKAAHDLEREQRHHEMDRSEAEHTALANYILYSPGHLQSYLGAYRAQGELAAIETIAHEQRAFEQRFLADHCTRTYAGIGG